MKESFVTVNLLQTQIGYILISPDQNTFPVSFCFTLWASKKKKARFSLYMDFDGNLHLYKTLMWILDSYY